MLPAKLFISTFDHLDRQRRAFGVGIDGGKERHACIQDIVINMSDENPARIMRFAILKRGKPCFLGFSLRPLGLSSRFLLRSQTIGFCLTFSCFSLSQFRSFAIAPGLLFALFLFLLPNLGKPSRF